MMPSNYVDGAGWISDDSSLYGDNGLKTILEHETRYGRTTVDKQDDLRTRNDSSRHKNGQPEIVDLTFESAHQDQPGLLNDSQTRSDLLPQNYSQPQVVGLTIGSAHHGQPNLMNDALTRSKSPLRSNGQPDAMNLTLESGRQGQPNCMEVDETVSGATTRQANESVDKFLQRVPVADKRCAQLGPWPWIDAPKTSPPREPSVREFVQGGARLLKAYDDDRAEVERRCTGQKSAVVTRKLKSHRDRLKIDLLNLAIASSTTCGKWMLFPTVNEVSHDWQVIAKATAEGKLGHTSKVATWDPSRSQVLICVYTSDFNDLADVKRVLKVLASLSLHSLTNRNIYYKCDAYTYLSIESENPYKLKASLYSSKDLLGPAAEKLVTPAVGQQPQEPPDWDF